MPRGIVVPVLETHPLILREFRSLDHYQRTVGGYIEAVDITTPAVGTMYMDEDGHAKQLAPNLRATLILMVHNPAFLFRGSLVVGPAIIMGGHDAEGETLDVADEYFHLLFMAERFKVEYQTADDADAWEISRVRYLNLIEAYRHAIGLSRRWAAVQRVRVVEA